MLKSIWDHPFTFWLLLSLPAIPMILGLTTDDPEAVSSLLHPTGEFAARFMIIAMMVTPLVMLFGNASWPSWLMKRRRYLGVAAFFYALAHTVLYILDEGAVAFTGGEVSKLYIWTGWIAFLIFVPLAITSTDEWVRRLGRSWKMHQGRRLSSDSEGPLSPSAAKLRGPAAKFRFPEGFSMRAEVQHFLLVGRAARVDKPRKEEAAGAGCNLWGKRADG